MEDAMEHRKGNSRPTTKHHQSGNLLFRISDISATG
jgi:hypothetical protein